MVITLELIFVATDGKTVRIVVNDPKDELTELEIQQAMNNILASDVFVTTKGASLASIKEARRVERSVNVMEF